MQLDLSRAQWRKSSYSGNSGNCVEVAIAGSNVGIRDSNDPCGPMLILTLQMWQALVDVLKMPPEP